MATITPSKVDRQSIVPFHLKLFYKNGAFHRLDEFDPHAQLPAHVNISTWQSCTLRELSHLLFTALPDLVPDPAIGTRLSFRLIFPDARNATTGPARFLTKELGSVIIGDGGPGIMPDEEEAAIVAGGVMSGGLIGDPEKTLQDAKFVIGDYVSCAILPPLPDGGVAPPPSGPRGGFGGGMGMGRGMGMGMGEFGGRGGMGPRENGFGGGFRGRGGHRGGGFHPGMAGAGGVPSGEWRRGERVPDGPSGDRARGYGGGFGGGGGRGRY